MKLNIQFAAAMMLAASIVGYLPTGTVEALLKPVEKR
jgi:hypothetical protein